MTKERNAGRVPGERVAAPFGGYRLRALTLAVALTGAGAVSPALAENEPALEPEQAEATETGVMLDTVTITGRGERIRDIPGSAHHLDRQELDRHGYTDPARILRTVPGVNAMEEEGHGQFPHISMRGVAPERNSRISVMEDGVLAGAPAPYAAPAAYYFPPIGRMDSVEVQKGSSAIKHGPYTVGGSLNMISTPIPPERMGRIRHERGERNSERTHAWVGSTEGQIGLLVETFTESSDGFKKLDFPLSGKNSDKPNNPVPDTGFDRDNHVFKLGWTSDPSAQLHQQVELKYSEDERSIRDTYLGLTEDDYRDSPFRRYAGSQLDEINTDNELMQLRHSIDFTPETRLTSTIYRSDTVRNWYKLHEVWDGDRLDGSGDPDFESISTILQSPGDFQGDMDWIRGRDSVDPDARGNVRANNREYMARGIQFRVDHLFDAFGWAHELEVGLRYHEDEEDRLQWQDSFAMENGMMVVDEEEEPGETTNRLSQADALAAHVQNTMRQGPWTLTAGVRYEDITQRRRDWDGPGRSSGNLDRDRDNDERVWIPGIGAVYDLDDHWSVLAGYHRGFAPAGNNPDSKAERSDAFEAGFRYGDRFTESEVIAFYNDYSNINIQCTAVGGGCGGSDIGDVVSAGEVKIYGLEASWHHDLGLARDWDYSVPVRLGYTLTESEFQQDIGSTAPNQWANADKGDSIPEVPQHQLNLGIGLARDAWSLDLNANYVSEEQAFADPDLRDLKIDSRWLLDASARYQLLDDVRLTARVENLTDKEYIAHHRPAGVRPGAPRTAWAGIQVDF